MKKMAKVMVLVLALCLVVPTVSFAAVTVLSASVISTGQNATGGYVYLADNAATGKAWTGNRWFQFTAAVSNAQLATALTAVSLSKTVWVGLASATQYAFVNYIYINQN